MKRRKSERIDSKKLATLVAEIAENKKAKAIKIFNVQSFTPIADYFVLCSSESKPQLKAIMDSISVEVKKKRSGEKSFIRFEGMIDSGWVILDLGPVVVHIMDEECRSFYNLEELWGKAAIVYHM